MPGAGRNRSHLTPCHHHSQGHHRSLLPFSSPSCCFDPCPAPLSPPLVLQPRSILQARRSLLAHALSTSLCVTSSPSALHLVFLLLADRPTSAFLRPSSASHSPALPPRPLLLTFSSAPSVCRRVPVHLCLLSLSLSQLSYSLSLPPRPSSSAPSPSTLTTSAHLFPRHAPRSSVLVILLCANLSPALVVGDRIVSSSAL